MRESLLNKVKVTDEFWHGYQELVMDTVIPYQEKILNDEIPGVEKSHALANFRIAAGMEEGEFYGMVFQDSDVAKWLEGVAYALEVRPDPEYDEFDTNSKNGNTLNTVTDALGHTSVTTYNIAMQPVSVSDKGDGTVQAISQNYTYDNKGRVKERKGSLGTSSTYDYDGKDRVTAMHYKNASGAEELRTTYTYDKSDNITSMTDYNVAGTTATPYRYTEYKYDKLKRVTSVTEMNTKKEPSALTAEEKEKATTKYNYDIDGNLLAVTYPKSDWKVTGQRYEYDKNKWLKTIKVVTEDGKEAVLRTYDYDEFGSVSDITDYRVMSKTGEIVKSPESTTCHYTYDTCMVTTPAGAPVAMVHCNNCTSDINAWVNLLSEFVPR